MTWPRLELCEDGGSLEKVVGFNLLKMLSSHVGNSCSQTCSKGLYLTLLHFT
jgi:hypothetical protein